MRTAAAATCLAAVLAASGCGGSKKDEGAPIPPSVASALKADMAIVQNRLNFAQDHPNSAGVGSCDDIANKSFPSIDSDLARVPNGVGSDVRDALSKSFDNLKNLAGSACDKVKSDSDQTNTTDSNTTPTQTIAPTPTETVPTETTPTQTTTTPEKKPKPPKTPKAPKPNQNPGNGNQNGNGDQGGGAGAPQSGGGGN
jgi:hypothetical protein